MITRLLDEVEREQEALNAAFYRISRAPENVDRAKVLTALNETGGQIAILVEKARGGPDETIYELRTVGGSHIIWGRAPGSDHPGDHARRRIDRQPGGQSRCSVTRRMVRGRDSVNKWSPDRAGGAQ